MKQNVHENLDTVNTKMMLVIGAYRRMLNLSRKFFCDKLGIANTTMEFHETGKQFVSQDSICKYVKILLEFLPYDFDEFYRILRSEAEKIQLYGSTEVNVQCLYAITNIANHLLFVDMERRHHL